MIVFTAREMNGGTAHEHVSELWWKNTDDGSEGHMTIAMATQWLDPPDRHAYVEDQRLPGMYVEAFVVKPENKPWYIRTAADGRWTDNLLALPLRYVKAA